MVSTARRENSSTVIQAARGLPSSRRLPSATATAAKNAGTGSSAHAPAVHRARRDPFPASAYPPASAGSVTTSEAGSTVNSSGASRGRRRRRVSPVRRRCSAHPSRPPTTALMGRMIPNVPSQLTSEGESVPAAAAMNPRMPAPQASPQTTPTSTSRRRDVRSSAGARCGSVQPKASTASRDRNRTASQAPRGVSRASGPPTEDAATSQPGTGRSATAAAAQRAHRGPRPASA